MSHAKKLPGFSVGPSTGEKQLANSLMRSKRIEIINTTQSVPKKNKIVQAEIGGEAPETGGSPGEMKSRCRPGRVKRASRWTNKFACAPTLFQNAGADSLYRAMPTRIGSKPSANSSLKSARVDVKAGASPATT
jgi:hypothetical protein